MFLKKYLNKLFEEIIILQINSSRIYLFSKFFFWIRNIENEKIDLSSIVNIYTFKYFGYLQIQYNFYIN